MPFVRQAWYVAAWAGDLDHDPLSRTLLNEPIVLYRRADGTPVALEDRCCHRSLPLSMGAIIGDNIRCGYHGLMFDPAGSCIAVPGQSKIPPGAALRSYSVVEKWRAIWIWMGDPALADTAAIPDVFWLDDPGWTPAPGYLHVEAAYQLLIDNLLDLTHVSYLHKSTLAGDDVEALVEVTTRREGNRVEVGRWILDVTPPPMYAAASGISGQVDRWQLITSIAPSTVCFDIGCALTGTGAPQGDRRQGMSMWSTHLITPETDTTTHYHWGFARDFRLDDEDVTELLRNGARTAFVEDADILGIQQRALERAAGAPRIDINIDNGPMQARRIVADLIEAELAARAGTAAA